MAWAMHLLRCGKSDLPIRSRRRLICRRVSRPMDSATFHNIFSLLLLMGRKLWGLLKQCQEGMSINHHHPRSRAPWYRAWSHFSSILRPRWLCWPGRPVTGGRVRAGRRATSPRASSPLSFLWPPQGVLGMTWRTYTSPAPTAHWQPQGPRARTAAGDQAPMPGSRTGKDGGCESGDLPTRGEVHGDINRSSTDDLTRASTSEPVCTTRAAGTSFVSHPQAAWTCESCRPTVLMGPSEDPRPTCQYLDPEHSDALANTDSMPLAVCGCAPRAGNSTTVDVKGYDVYDDDAPFLLPPRKKRSDPKAAWQRRQRPPVSLWSTCPQSRPTQTSTETTTTSGVSTTQIRARTRAV